MLAQAAEATRLLEQGRPLPDRRGGRRARGDRARARRRRARARRAARDRDACSGSARALRRFLASRRGERARALRRVLDRPDARRAGRRNHRLLRRRRHARRPREPAPARAARRVARRAAAHALAHGGHDGALRGGPPGPLRHRARGALGAARPQRRARALPGDRARDERERRRRCSSSRAPSSPMGNRLKVLEADVQARGRGGATRGSRRSWPTRSPSVDAAARAIARGRRARGDGEARARAGARRSRRSSTSRGSTCARARHPLLGARAGAHVVPSDLALAERSAPSSSAARTPAARRSR